MFKINKKNYEKYIYGSFISSCWGWTFNLKTQKEKYKKILEKEWEINFFDLEEFSDEEFLISWYWVWKPKWEEKNFLKLLKKWFNEFQKICWDKKISWIVSGEIWWELTAIEMANELNLKLVNWDLVWWRAVPEISMDCFWVNNKKITPAILVWENEEILILKNCSTEILENISREFFENTWWSVWLIWYLISVKDAKKNLPQKSIENNLEIWEKFSLNYEKNFLWEWEIFSIKEKESKWFDKKIIKIWDEKKYFEINICNEFLSVKDSEWNFLAKAPEKIFLIDKKNLEPIYSKEIFLWQIVKIFSMEEGFFWKDDENKKIFEKYF